MKKLMLALVAAGLLWASPAIASESVPGSETITIENQSEVVRIKEQKRSDLESRKVELKRQIDTISVEIKDLEQAITEKEAQIESLEQSLEKTREVDTESGDQSIDEQREQTEEELKKDLDQAKLDLVDLEQELDSKQRSFIANQQTLNEIDQALAETREEVREERSQFLVSLWRTISDYVGYLGVMALIIVLYVLLRRAAKRFLPGQTAVLWGDVILRIGLFVALSIVFIYAFADRIVNIITLLSVFSAALVVALQDFVSSFFAWLYIRSKSKYRVGDVIKISGANGYFFGRGKKIEVFRTILDESMGDQDPTRELNKEMPTGRVVSFPNNVIMRDALVNFTQNHRSMWQSVDIIITFASDWELAEREIEKLINRLFDEEWFKEHKIERSYQPKVLVSIADDGVRFTIWFPARIGEYRETLEMVSKELLRLFAKKGIDLAYKSMRIYTKGG